MSTNWPDDKPRGLLSLLELVGPVKPPGDPFRDVKNIQLRHGGSQRQEHSSLTPCASAAGACGTAAQPCCRIYLARLRRANAPVSSKRGLGGAGALPCVRNNMGPLDERPEVIVFPEVCSWRTAYHATVVGK